MERIASAERNTLETRIWVEINLDGVGRSDISTGIGFFD
ncbi:MAG: bifunctional histidinol-phosphatase/imidazoleglycerol-phosphate dehydratase, partial [Betaproteobacteria bacterium]|nr:bifunctional histidinol-phosphatase/imidazoleglycerol-phosphate dehydratase [Betaproteobacteria bacterium]